MPVQIEWIESPTEQDWIDLNKLYKDAPKMWFEEKTEVTAQDYIRQKQAQGFKIVAGRFNDRLIATAAVKLMDNKAKTYEIDDLLVRGITRERGVARQMLVRICQWGDEQKCSLWVKDHAAKLRVLLEYGFVHEQGKWYRQG